MTLSAPLDVAVVGAGHLGKIHARVLSEIPGVRLAAVVDPDPAAAKAVSSERRCTPYPDVASLPASIKAAVVATPTVAHHAVATALLDRGIACLVEKPLAASVAEAQDLVARARRLRLPLMVGHVERFNPAVVALLERNVRPRFVECHRVSPFSFRSADIGVVLDMMIHDLDIILHLVDSPVESVDAVGVGVLGDPEDLANVRILFENGAVANLTASRLALKTERKMRMFAPDCYVTLDFLKKTGRVIRPTERMREKLEGAKSSLGTLTPLQVMLQRLLEVETLEIEEFEPLKREDEEFVAAVREGRDAQVTGEHGVRALEVAERIAASIREHLARREPGPTR
jgi:predicted dehydrogenase